MNRIEILRLVNNKTQKDLAKYLNVSKQAIFYYGQGKRNPKPENWQALTDCFNVSVPCLRGATTHEVLDSAKKNIYSYIIEAMDQAFNDYVFLPETKERVLKAIAYSIDNGELNRMNIYLVQSTDCLMDQAMQNAIVVAENRDTAIKRFSKELCHNPYCQQSYRSMWFSRRKINISKSRMPIQYGGDTWQLDKVEYEQEQKK